MRLSLGGKVDCTINTCSPLTVSSNEVTNSPSLNLVNVFLPSSSPRELAILSAIYWLFSPAKTLISGRFDISNSLVETLGKSMKLFCSTKGIWWNSYKLQVCRLQVVIVVFFTRTV